MSDKPDRPESLPDLPPLLPIAGRVQHYDWGGTRFIPELLAIENPQRRPHAEYWLGAHPRAPATATVGGVETGLDELIARAPERLLGASVAERFDGLPFLFKILDVKRPLSIQVHPDRAGAEAGFARENAAGIALDAPHRVFRDPNPKPEFLLALDDFRLLHGFRSETDLCDLLATVSGLESLAAVVKDHGRAALVQHVLDLAPDVLKPAIDALYAHARERPPHTLDDRDQPWPWLLDWQRIHRDDPARRYDRGLLFLLLMNIVRLRRGEGIYTNPGHPHAYLDGHGIELMGNSDNTIRAGLTGKHTDPVLLMEYLVIDAPAATIVKPRIEGRTNNAAQQQVFQTDAFRLDLLRLDPRQSTSIPPGDRLAILFCIDGAAELEGGLSLSQGRAVYVLPGAGVEIHSLDRSRISLVRASG